MIKVTDNRQNAAKRISEFNRNDTFTFQGDTFVITALSVQGNYCSATSLLTGLARQFVVATIVEPVDVELVIKTKSA